MQMDSIFYRKFPKLDRPILVIGFSGWGNALNVSNGIVKYLIGKLKAEEFAAFNADVFYRYDERRPFARVKEGKIRQLNLPEGAFYAAENEGEGRDFIIMSADEPHLRWLEFTEIILSICLRAHVETIISVGGMYDEVLHTQTLVSGIASDEPLREMLAQKHIGFIEYTGPSAIHSLIQTEAEKHGIPCMSLWGHCPHYIQDVTHLGLVSHMSRLVAEFAEMPLDTREMDMAWRSLVEKIEDMISSEGLEGMIEELKKGKARGSLENIRKTIDTRGKVIDLSGHFDPGLR